MSDKRIAEKILISLPEKYDLIVTVIEETKDIFKFSVQELMWYLKTFEQSLGRHSKN